MAAAELIQRHHLTSFIGREAEIDEVVAALRASPLVTLTGPGGSGKTRLAIEVGRRLSATSVDRSYLVDLAPITTGELIGGTVIAALGGREEPGTPPAETAAGLLAGTTALVVVDNCEHLVEPAARIAHDLLSRVPNLVLLATSREPLGIAGEARYPVPPLREGDAVQLFAERARLANPSFELSPQLRPVVRELCARLDDLPLAIELAAARTSHMPVAEILSRIDDRLELLNRGGRTTDARHQTLRGTLAWSYELLADEQRAAFVRLTVFAGGFNAVAAEAVTACGADEVIAQLVDKSMIVAGEGVDGRARFRMLETIRQYGLERFEEDAASAATTRRHFDFFSAMAAQAEPELVGARQGVWLDRLDEEHDNLRAALAWGLREDAEAALTMAGHLGLFWRMRGHYAEGHQRLIDLLSSAPGASVHCRATALAAAGRLSTVADQTATAEQELDHALELWRQLDEQDGLPRALIDRATLPYRHEAGGEQRWALLEEALDLATRAGNTRAMSEAQFWMGRHLVEKGMVSEGQERVHEAARIAESAGDSWALGFALDHLGHVTYAQGQVETALRYHERSRGLFEEIREPFMVAHAEAYLGVVSLALHREAVATRFFEAALTAPIAYREPVAVEGYARLAGARGSYTRALRLHGAAASMPWAGPRMVTDLERQPWIAAARRAVGSEAAAAEWELGAAMSPEAAVDYALSDAGEPADRSGPLTKREREVAILVGQGLRNREIAERLFIAPRTVEAHVEHIMNKLGYQSRAQIASWATGQGLVHT